MPKEGFWCDKNKPLLISDDSWKGRDAFLSNLGTIEALLYSAQLDFIEHWKTDFQGFREKHGYPNVVNFHCRKYACRFCDHQEEFAEFRCSGWIWPTYFQHYIESHNVKPSDEFIEFVTREASSL